MKKRYNIIMGVFKIDLYEEIQRLMKELTASISKLRDNGVKLAEAERNYKVSLCQQALKVKAEGQPITLINTIIYGIDEVAEKRLKRDIAEANYKTNQEHINITKLKLRVLEEQLSREWGNVKNDI